MRPGAAVRGEPKGERNMIRTTYKPEDYQQLNNLDRTLNHVSREERGKHTFEIYVKDQGDCQFARFAWVDATHALRSDAVSCPLENVVKVIHVYG